MPDRNPSHHPVKPLPGLVPWIGGKRNLASQIIPRIESVPHTCYAEPFIGMGGVFLRRARRAPSEAINDRSGEVVNLFRIIQRHPAALAAALRWEVTTFVRYEQLRRIDVSTLTDIERAARFIYLQACAFGGKLAGSFSRGPGRHRGLRLNQRLPLFRAIHHRMSLVSIDNLDFEDFIGRWDKPATLFYLDPPYWGLETLYGKGLFARADFERLARVLRGIKGRFIMSLNDRREVRETFAGFKQERVSLVYRVNGPQRVTELIISNPRRAA